MYTYKGFSPQSSTGLYRYPVSGDSHYEVQERFYWRNISVPKETTILHLPPLCSSYSHTCELQNAQHIKFITMQCDIHGMKSIISGDLRAEFGGTNDGNTIVDSSRNFQENLDVIANAFYPITLLSS